MVYGPVSANVPQASVVAVTGPPGSGRTSLLLTLTGRMDADSGTLVLNGHRMGRGARAALARRDVHRWAAIAHLRGFDDLDDGLTVSEVVRERLALTRRIGHRVGSVADRQVAAVWGAAHAPWGPSPAAADPIWSLSRTDRALLQIRLAMLTGPAMPTGPGLLAIDGVDSFSGTGRDRLAALVDAAAGHGSTVLLGCADPAGLPVDLVLPTRPTTPSPSSSRKPTDTCVP